MIIPITPKILPPIDINKMDKKGLISLVFPYILGDTI